MADENRILRFENYTSKMAEVYVNKNNDYGNSFADSIKDFGIVAGVVRMSDKMNRIKTLTDVYKQQRVNDETIKDTLLDLANYAIMTLVEMDILEEKANDAE